MQCWEAGEAPLHRIRDYQSCPFPRGNEVLSRRRSRSRSRANGNGAKELRSRRLVGSSSCRVACPRSSALGFGPVHVQQRVMSEFCQRTAASVCSSLLLSSHTRYYISLYLIWMGKRKDAPAPAAVTAPAPKRVRARKPGRGAKQAPEPEPEPKHSVAVPYVI
jgi:hypothetical protein